MIILAFIYYRYFIMDFSLVSVGMISFVIVAQLGPAFFGAIFWKRGSLNGAVAGIIVGMLICFYTIMLPFLLSSINPESNFFKEGFFGFTFLQPFQLDRSN